MFYTYILRSLSQPEQRYIGSTADLQAVRFAIRRFFLLAKISGVQRSGRRMPVNLSSVALCEGGSSWRRRAITPRKQEKNMFYTYILRSLSRPFFSLFLCRVGNSSQAQITLKSSRGRGSKEQRKRCLTSTQRTVLEMMSTRLAC